jgi:hypothetical protein
MKVATWKFWAVIAAIVLMIVSYILSESTKVSVAAGNFFNVVAWVLFIALVIGGASWFFTSKTR